jgi:hypothetical protein
MGAAGAIIMSFFGAVFAAITLATQWGLAGGWLALPFALFLLIALAAWRTARAQGGAMPLPPGADKVIGWSSTAEGVGIFLAANLVINLHHPEWLLPAMALVVGLHFIPIAVAIPFRPFLALAAVLLVVAAAGFLLHAPLGPELAGFGAAAALWSAAAMAVRRQARWREAGAR